MNGNEQRRWTIVGIVMKMAVTIHKYNTILPEIHHFLKRVTVEYGDDKNDARDHAEPDK